MAFDRPAYMREWMRTRRREFFDGKCCAACGSFEQLELDHIDRFTKESHRIWSWAKERRETELAKCQILCQRCHYMKTSKEVIGPREHGTLNMYRKGKCRCSLCRSAATANKRDWRSKKKAMPRKLNG